MRLDVPFSLHGFPVPFRRRFPALLLCLANFCGALFACLHWSTAPALPPCFACWRSRQCCPCGVIAVYPMQTVFRFSRCGAGSGNKKSPHNNLNLTIFRDSLDSGLLCSDKRAKNLLRLLWTSNGNTKCLCHIKLLEYTATEIELCQQKF